MTPATPTGWFRSRFIVRHTAHGDVLEDRYQDDALFPPPPLTPALARRRFARDLQVALTHMAAFHNPGCRCDLDGRRRP